MILSNTITIDNLLKDSTYSVPDYQRAYEWKTPEIEDFWDDLTDYLELKIKNPEVKSSLFLGTFILYKNKERHYEIVDGQQRITTIFILLIAIRNFLGDLIARDIKFGHLDFEELKYQVGDRISFKNSRTGKSTVTRFEASPAIKETISDMSRTDWRGEFKIKIEGKQVKRQINSIKPIYQYFLTKLQEDIEPEKFNSLMDTIYDIEVIKIEINDMKEAFALFERTNARGRDLEVSDLLKNHLFMNLRSEEMNLTERWSSITDNAGNQLIRMLKYFYVSQNGSVRKSVLYKALKDFAGGDPKTLLDEIEVFSSFYKLFQTANSSDDLRDYFLSLSNLESVSEDRIFYVYQSIDGLRLFGVTQAYPLIYAFLRSFYNNKLELDDRHRKTISMFFQSLENYHFINNFVCDRVGNDVEKLYANFSKRFSDAKTKYAFELALFELYKNMISKKASKEEFIDRFTQFSYLQGIKPLMYIFDRFNSFDLNGNKKQKSNWYPIYQKNSKYSHNSVNIEHWFPKTPKNGGSDIDVDNIGNLLAISSNTNGKLGNKTPQEKFQFLSKNSELDTFPHNKKFMEKYSPFEQWGTPEIKQRALDLANEAYQVIWEFNPPMLEPKP
jgi:uncharacterized protein with ParB-like and HNH nuclease domain